MSTTFGRALAHQRDRADVALVLVDEIDVDLADVRAGPVGDPLHQRGEGRHARHADPALDVLHIGRRRERQNDLPDDARGVLDRRRLGHRHGDVEGVLVVLDHEAEVDAEGGLRTGDALRADEPPGALEARSGHQGDDDEAEGDASPAVDLQRPKRGEIEIAQAAGSLRLAARSPAVAPLRGSQRLAAHGMTT